MKKLSTQKITDGYYAIIVDGNSNHIIAYFVRDVDGYFYYINENERGQGGTMASYTLREIADLLDELNKPWDNQIAEYFKNEKNNEDSEEA